jgi:hypothetical protein
VLKTIGTLFTLSPKIQSGRLTLDDTPLKIEEQQTYLGVTFDKRMTWKQLLVSNAKLDLLGLPEESCFNVIFIG